MIWKLPIFYPYRKQVLVIFTNQVLEGLISVWMHCQSKVKLLTWYLIDFQPNLKIKIFWGYLITPVSDTLSLKNDLLFSSRNAQFFFSSKNCIFALNECSVKLLWHIYNIDVSLLLLVHIYQKRWHTMLHAKKHQIQCSTHRLFMTKRMYVHFCTCVSVYVLYLENDIIHQATNP